MRRVVLSALLAASCVFGQNSPDRKTEADTWWNIYFQATSIGQYHGTFNSPYSGRYSLQNYPERDVSLTSTMFLGFRPAKNMTIYVNPEIAGGRGFSGVNGLANSSNGELPRVASATPKPYLARLYVSRDFGFGSGKETVEGGPNQLPGDRPINRYTVTAGRFTVTDFFDNNRYSHDPRSQFMGWGVMFNGAWDYPADVRGYTWGWVHELHLRNWSIRYASAAMPREANGLRFDRRLFRNRGDVYEGEYRYKQGAVRFLHYRNHANAGTYGEAAGPHPDVTATRRNGTLKYGFGLNAEHAVTDDFGVFGRLGWNDGKTESFAFTAIDNMVTAGVSLKGTKWRRRSDTVGAELSSGGISKVHADYLARGGNDFLIGDGTLNYGRETIAEAYYNARLFPGFYVAFDLQHASNPGYNRDRGPVWIPSIRLHMEFK